MPILIKAYDLLKEYRLSENIIVRAIDFEQQKLEIKESEFLVIMGPSGSGKTTLLNLLGGIDRPTRGEVFIGTTCLTKLSERKLTRFRRHYLSYVFQFYSLIPTLTAIENVMIAANLVGIKGKKAFQEAKAFLQKVGLEERMFNFPAQMSGGEQQRVAIARALAKHPQVIFVDEPTAQLDTKTGLEVVKILREISQDGTTVIMVTHDEKMAHFGDRIIFLDSGKIVKSKSIEPLSANMM